MKEFKYVIKDEQGIHARPAGMLVKELAKRKANVTIQKSGDDRVVNAKSIMAVMSLGVKKDNEVLITADGGDEEEAIQAAEKVLTENL